jgi:hypothetical protein
MNRILSIYHNKNNGVAKILSKELILINYLSTYTFKSNVERPLFVIYKNNFLAGNLMYFKQILLK